MASSLRFNIKITEFKKNVKAVDKRDKILSMTFSSMTFCRCRDFVINDCFDTHKLYVVDYKSLSITEYDRLIFSFQKRK